MSLKVNQIHSVSQIVEYGNEMVSDGFDASDVLTHIEELAYLFDQAFQELRDEYPDNGRF